MPHFCPDIIEVHALDGYVLRVKFADGVIKDCDLSSLTEQGVFTCLKNRDFFLKAHPQDGAIVWSDEIDIAPEFLYEHGITSTAVTSGSQVR